MKRIHLRSVHRRMVLFACCCCCRHCHHHHDGTTSRGLEAGTAFRISRAPGWLVVKRGTGQATPHPGEDLHNLIPARAGSSQAKGREIARVWTCDVLLASFALHRLGADLLSVNEGRDFSPGVVRRAPTQQTSHSSQARSPWECLACPPLSSLTRGHANDRDRRDPWGCQSHATTLWERRLQLQLV